MEQSLKTVQSYISAQVVDYGIYTHYISSLSQVQLATMEVHRRKNSQGQEHWLLLVLDCLARLPKLGRARDRSPGLEVGGLKSWVRRRGSEGPADTQGAE